MTYKYYPDFNLRKSRVVKEYREVSFPKTRIATLDVLEIGRKKHHIKALLELDVTNARSLIVKQKKADQMTRLFSACE